MKIINIYLYILYHYIYLYNVKIKRKNYLFIIFFFIFLKKIYIFSMLVKVIPNKTNKFEEIPFPENFKIITKQRRSTLNPNLFTGFFYWKDNKKEYHADIDSGIVLQEIGWNDWNTKRKSEIAISWIAHVLHPIEGIISLDDIELEKNYFSKWNPLKPNFEIPKAIIKNDEIIEIRYWNREEEQ